MNPDSDHNYYNKQLQPFARNLRNEGTKAEACLWKFALRASQMRGYPFRRQRPVLTYIADFMCMPLKLIIEVDGITHNDEQTAKNDEARTQALQAAGFTVLRFTDAEVLNNINAVYSEIENWIIAFEEKAK